MRRLTIDMKLPRPLPTTRVAVYGIPAQESTDGSHQVCLRMSAPEMAANRRWLLLGHVPLSAIGADVQTALEANADLIADALDGYLGAEWDGQRHIGRWATDTGHPAPEQQDGALQRVTEALDRVRYRPAAAVWFRHWRIDVDLAAPPGASLDEIVAAELEVARENDFAILDPADVRAYLVRTAAEWLKAHQDWQHDDIRPNSAFDRMTAIVKEGGST